ncbi:MAG: hypothetical protein HYR95_02400 [Candidatus Colwellbacteria bacterium]|nr:hypothetical protein [Candidatus Colwellbacteria bacterium]
MANEKAAELKKVQELRPDDTAAIDRALDNYNKNALRLKTRVQLLEESSENPNVDAVLDKLAENTIKHQQLFEELKAKHEGLGGKFDNAREGVGETLEHVVKNLDKPKKAAERLDKAIEAQRDNQTKELRAVHLLNQLEHDTDSPEFVDKLLELKDKHINKLETKFRDGLVHPSQVGGLVKGLSDDEVEIFEVLRELEHRLTDIPDELKLDDLEEEALEEASHKESDFVSRAKGEIERAEKMIRELEIKLSAAGGTIREVVGASNADNLLKEAKHKIGSAKKAFEEKKYGEAYGQANSAYALAKAGLGKLSNEVGEKHEKILCIEEYEPVCGVDERTYGNECKARVANVRVRYKGECRAKEESRVEKPKEEGKLCTQVYDPVCGADDRTYSNSCFADIARIQVKHRGECGKPTKPTLDSESLKFEVVPQSPTTKISPDSTKIEALPKTPSIDTSAGSVKVETGSEATVNVSRIWNVAVMDDGFSPMELRVRKGDTVVWTNKSGKSSWPASAVHPTHDVYPERGGCISSAFDACKGLGLGEAFKFTFNQVGSWKYHDHLNSTHFGTIVVE